MNKRRKVESNSIDGSSSSPANLPIVNPFFDEYLTDDLLAIIIEFIGDDKILNYMLVNKRFNRVINDDQYDCFRHFEYELPFTFDPPKNCNLVRKLRICSIDEDVYDFDEEIAMMKFNKVTELIVLDECSYSFGSACKVIDASNVKILSINFAISTDVLKQITEDFTNLETLIIADFEGIAHNEIEKELPTLTHFIFSEDLDYSYSYEPFEIDRFCNVFNFTPNLRTIECEPIVGYMNLNALIKICSQLESLEYIKVGIVLENSKIESYPSLNELMKRKLLKLELNCYSHIALDVLTKYFTNFKDQTKITLEERLYL
ncbi:Hypothetical protein NAEGRDRAFT_49165 [Naegleria gruberi]|uniref:F-box domain-containing protein n=1 Tax=Naegleria gruberi TaxID=5762 RepID=D2VFQ3_NAEGR|nr:uncharacterized protein NAEGRDRAFT_49165 [Naegleria gruberi]EFC44397.1 Hypothetical protein NAEGRDRAFT_49165 [Naegleria gruberi]|eukprot:XP_002677141.1 Hypothetical protein NAEGRDRAFT_49165 [Naegleria gruberi strain NEG-M]